VAPTTAAGAGAGAAPVLKGAAAWVYIECITKDEDAEEEEDSDDDDDDDDDSEKDSEKDSDEVDDPDDSSDDSPMSGWMCVPIITSDADSEAVYTEFHRGLAATALENLHHVPDAAERKAISTVAFAFCEYVRAVAAERASGPGERCPGARLACPQKVCISCRGWDRSGGAASCSCGVGGCRHGCKCKPEDMEISFPRGGSEDPALTKLRVPAVPGPLALRAKRLRDLLVEDRRNATHAWVILRRAYAADSLPTDHAAVRVTLRWVDRISLSRSTVPVRSSYSQFDP